MLEQSTPKTVVVADDESHIRNVVALKLRNAGYTVVPVADGAEALEAIAEHTPDLVVTDYHMPGMNGHELCKALGEASGRGETVPPTIMLTAQGHELPELPDKSIVRLVMSKPFSPRQLLGCVKELLGEAA
jgi:CheY-like chemotaxis protein